MNKRGKTAVFLIMLVLLPVPSIFAGEITAVWTRLYERAVTYPQKQQIMMNIVEQNSRDMIPLLMEALDTEVRNLGNTENITEKSMQIDLMKLIVMELGDLRANEAAEILHETVLNVEDPFLKGEAIISLGKVGARHYAAELALMLRNLNFNMDSNQNQREDEILAYALVIALERLRDAEGYEPVFFASLGWYSPLSGVKERAKKAMRTMVEDPSPQLLGILRDESNLEHKLAALRAEDNSDASEVHKAEVAAVGLTEGLRYSPRTLTEKQQLKNLRMYALGMLKKYPMPRETDIASSMDRMIQLYREDRVYDEDEMITLLEAMGSFEGQERIARSLASFLGYYNQRREAAPPESYRIVKTLIQALGSVGHQAGIEELTFVTLSDYWEASIQREAKAALEKIGR
jgi:hypothetical protein